MYRAVDTRNKIELCTVDQCLWLTLEPEIVAAIASKLSRRERGYLRSTCKTWYQAVTSGVQNLAVVSYLEIRKC